MARGIIALRGLVNGDTTDKIVRNLEKKKLVDQGSESGGLRRKLSLRVANRIDTDLSAST